MDVGEARAVLAGLAARTERDAGRVRLEVLESGAARLVLDHPRAHNALTAWMMVDLADAVRALSRDEVSGWTGAVVVLASAEPETVSFCAGGHLRDVRSALVAPEQGREMARAMTAVLGGLRDLPAVSVAALGGLALGGGAELTTSCDFRVAHERAAVAFVQAQMGVAAGWGATPRLVELVGRTRALRLLARGERLSAREALEWGLVDAVVEGPLEAAVAAWVAPMLALAPQALRAVKQQVVEVGRTPPSERQVALFGEVWGGAAHRAALGLEP